ncbi:MAG: hypothetical protein ABJD11_10745 [Gemmatimonadota bacterium]
MKDSRICRPESLDRPGSHSSALSGFSAFSVLSVLSIIACGGDSGGPSGGNTNVKLDGSHAVHDSIGSAGGTLIATSTAGITYTLTIPAGALQAPTLITLTPIASQGKLPVSGGFAAGADFQPAGLHFAQPVRLSASPLPSATSGIQFAALTFEGDGDSLGLAPMLDSSGTAIAFLTHFSGASFVFGTTADLQALANLAGTGVANQPFINQLATLGAPQPPGNPAALPILQAWFSTVVLPELQGAGNDAELIIAVADYGLWHSQAAAYLTGSFPLQPLFPAPDLAVSGLGAEEGQASQAVAPRLRNAVAGNNAVCLGQHSLESLLNVLYWQRYATHFGVDNTTEQLDPTTVEAGICGHVVETSDTLAGSLQAGFPHTLVVGFGLEAGGVPLSGTGSVAFAVSVSATGAAIQNTSGNTDAAGFWGGSVVTAQGTGPVLIAAHACMIDPATGATTGVCGDASIFRGSLDLTGTWTGSYRFPGTNGEIPLELHITQVQNGVQGSFSTPVPNGPFGALSATLSNDTVFNFTLDEGAPCTNRVVSGTGRVHAPDLIDVSLQGSDCTGSPILGSSEMVVVRARGVPVHGLYVGMGSCFGTDCVASKNPYTAGTLVFQFGDTLRFDAPNDFVSVFSDFFGEVGVLPGGGAALSGNDPFSGSGLPQCLITVPHAPCGPDASSTDPLSGTLSGTDLNLTYTDIEGFGETFKLQKQ